MTGTSCLVVRCFTNWAIEARWYPSIRNTSKGGKFKSIFLPLLIVTSVRKLTVIQRQTINTPTPCGGTMLLSLASMDWMGSFMKQDLWITHQKDSYIISSLIGENEILWSINKYYHIYDTWCVFIRESDNSMVSNTIWETFQLPVLYSIRLLWPISFAYGPNPFSARGTTSDQW